MNHSGWLPHQSCHILIPANQPLETGPVIPSTRYQSQSLPTIPGLPRMVHPFSWNGTSRIGSFSNSHTISSDRLVALREEANLRGLQSNRASIVCSCHRGEMFGTKPWNWGLANGNISIPRNVAATSQVGSTIDVHASITPTWAPHRSPTRLYQQASSEIIHHSFPAAISDPSSQLDNFLSQCSEPSSSSEIVSQPGVRVHTSQQPLLMSGLLMGQ